jgi:hypothetical protein
VIAGGVAARRASFFAPPPHVWQADGAALRAAVPAPHAPIIPPGARALELAAMIVDAGAAVVIEHGVVAGEILGLEVARVVIDDFGARIEVGVGRHDREAFGILHGDLPTPAALASVVSTVRGHRRPDAPDHPLKRLAGERWLRERLLVEPEIAGATHLERADGPEPRESVKESLPAVAVGADARGRPVVAVTSVGIDLELVPYAADARAWLAPDARLVLVVPERDAHPVTKALAETLADPAVVVGVAGDWRR